MSGPSFFGAPCDQPLPTKEPLRSPWTVPVDRGAIAASSEGRAAGGGGCGPSGVFRCTGLFDRRRFCLFISFFIRFFSFLRRFRSLRSRLASLSSLLEEEEDSLRRRRPMCCVQYLPAATTHVCCVQYLQQCLPCLQRVLRAVFTAPCLQPALRGGGTLHVH